MFGMQGWTIPVDRWTPSGRPAVLSLVSQIRRVVSLGTLVTGVDHSSENLVARLLRWETISGLSQIKTGHPGWERVRIVHEYALS